MKILELFSGYGTATFALKRLGIPHEIRRLNYIRLTKLTPLVERVEHDETIQVSQ